MRYVKGIRISVLSGRVPTLGCRPGHNEATLVDDLIHKSHRYIQLQLATGGEPPSSLSELD